jgi:hypothetical protein
MRLKSEKGQVLAIVVVIMLIVTTLVPVLVMYSQREAAWTSKQAKSTTAFHLAEAGTEKGYLQISISTMNWVNLQLGTGMTNFKFDHRFDDLSGGSYTVSITSGPLSQEATIISIGHDTLNREVRAIQAVYANATVGNVAIMGGSGVDVSGNNLTVEWGSIVSPNPITVNGANHPSYWSASSVSLDANGSALPNCDTPNCWWWHSYFAGIPAMPLLDFNAYKSDAQNKLPHSSSCGMTYYQAGSPSGGCSDLTGRTFYVEGSWTGFDGPIIGSVIVKQSMSTPNGAMSGNSISAPLPQQAWKQYCNDWAFYTGTYDSAAAIPFPTQCPGIYSTYLSGAGLTYPISPVVNGLLYVGGDFTGPNGGGNTDLAYGVLIVKGQVNLNSNSHCKFYYNATASQALQTTQINLSRQSWKDVNRGWPAGL